MQLFCDKIAMANRNMNHPAFEVLRKSSYMQCAITMSKKNHYTVIKFLSKILII